MLARRSGCRSGRSTSCCGIEGALAAWPHRSRPGHPPGGRGKGRLSAASVTIVAEAIRDEYLTRQRKPAEAVMRTVRDRYRLGGIKPPTANTVRTWVRLVRAGSAAHA